MRPVEDLTGRVFGRWLVVIHLGLDGRFHHWLCRCTCGTVRSVSGMTLRQGQSTSCGCYRLERVIAAQAFRRTHGRSRTSLYNVWSSMLARCRRETSTSFKDYGGRGITVCDRWLSFENFLADMGERPPGMSLERINNDAGYGPENCKWATSLEQAANKRKSTLVTAFGKTKTLGRWAKEHGMHRATLEHRLKLGAPLEKAVTSEWRQFVAPKGQQCKA